MVGDASGQLLYPDKGRVWLEVVVRKVGGREERKELKEGSRLYSP